MDQSKISQMAQSAAPLRVQIHPGMTSTEERNFLYNLQISRGTERGEIVDAGVFLGASTKAFAAALEYLGTTTRAIHSYEIGVFTPFTARAASHALRLKPEYHF